MGHDFARKCYSFTTRELSSINLAAVKTGVLPREVLWYDN